VFTEPLPTNVRLFGNHYSGFQASFHTAPSLRLFTNLKGFNVGITDGRDKHAVEMDSGAMTYIPSSGIQKLGGGYTHTQQGDHISLLLRF
jgi:hypothetical protein